MHSRHDQQNQNDNTTSTEQHNRKKVPKFQSDVSFWQRHRKTLKILPLLILILLSGIPMSMVYDLARDRMDYRDEAIRTTTQAWGESNDIFGPVLEIPVTRIRQQKEGDKWVGFEEHDYIYLTPDELQVEVDAHHTTRQKGIFDIALGRFHVVMNGTFSAARMEELHARHLIQTPGKSLHLVVAMNQTNGVKNAQMNWNGMSPPVRPHNSFQAFDRSKSSGIAIELGSSLDELIATTQLLNKPIAQQFSIALELAGTDHFSVPVSAATQTMTMRSDWPHPAFGGMFLPTERTLNERGFDATWMTNELQSGLEATFWRSNGLPSRRSFEVRFKDPSDTYNQFLRTSKYGLLLILLTFAVYFLFELISQERIHVIQYGLVGASLSIFFLLLLAGSEHIGFDWAFLTSASATVVLVATYLSNVLQKRKLVLLQSALMGGTFWFMYHLVGMEEGSLVTGSAGAFLTLSTIMWTSRKIDWYAIQASPPRQTQGSAKTPPTGTPIKPI